MGEEKLLARLGHLPLPGPLATPSSGLALEVGDSGGFGALQTKKGRASAWGLALIASGSLLSRWASLSFSLKWEWESVLQIVMRIKWPGGHLRLPHTKCSLKGLSFPTSEFHSDCTPTQEERH